MYQSSKYKVILNTIRYQTSNIQLLTYLERIFSMTFLTQGAVVSRQISWPVRLRVALQVVEDRWDSQRWHQPIWDKNIVALLYRTGICLHYSGSVTFKLLGAIGMRGKKSGHGLRHWMPKRRNSHDLCVLTVRSGRKELHTLNQSSDPLALRLDAATARLHSKASQTHACREGIGQSHKNTKANRLSYQVRWMLWGMLSKLIINSPSDMVRMARKTTKTTTEIWDIFSKAFRRLFLRLKYTVKV